MASLDFFGLQRDRAALPNLTPLMERVVTETSNMAPVPGSAPMTVAGGHGHVVTGGPMAFFQKLRLPRANTFPIFIRSYAETVRTSRVVGVPGVNLGMLESFLPEEYEDRQSLPFFSRLGYFFRTRIFPRDWINSAETGFLRAFFQLVGLDWEGVDEWGGEDGNLQQLTTYFVELFHGRFKDRNGMKIAFDEDIGTIRLDKLEVSPAVAGKLFYVLIEFLFDKLFRVPIGEKDPMVDLKTYTCAKAGLITTRISNVKLNGTGADYSDLVAAVMTYAARRAEKMARATVGGLIRGGGIASINNEVVSEIIASLASNLAKKSTERLTHGILTGYITDPTVGGSAQQKETVLALLKYLHQNVALPAGVTLI